MSTATTPAPAVSDTDKDDELDHWYCECDPTVMLCGVSADGLREGHTGNPANICLVCDDLVDRPCERCGQ